MIAPPDDRRGAAVRRLSGCCVLALAGCRAPSLYTESVVAMAPPTALGLPAPRAAGAAAAGVAAATADAGPFAHADAHERPDRGERGGSSSAAGDDAHLFDDFAAPDAGGRLTLYVDPSLAWAPQDPQSHAPQQPDDARWSDFLPLGRASVLAAGYELPRAFGFGVAYTRLQRDIEVTAVRVGVDGAPPQLVDFLSVKADSTVDNVMGRLDAWIFPFWNVSVLGGWTWNESTSEVTVSIPLPVNPRDVTFRVPTHQDGPTWGFGTNLAGGYGEWFVSGDALWIFADMQNFAVIEGFLGSIRSGWNGKIDGKAVRFWGGATYWDTATTVEGDVVTSGSTVHFQVEQGPVTPYSLQIGCSVDLSRGYGLMLEGHLLRDVQMLVVSAALRF
jgi:hypothetical protein